MRQTVYYKKQITKYNIKKLRLFYNYKTITIITISAKLKISFFVQTWKISQFKTIPVTEKVTTKNTKFKHLRIVTVSKYLSISTAKTQHKHNILVHVYRTYSTCNY